jgi:hypothetical protein
MMEMTNAPRTRCATWGRLRCSRSHAPVAPPHPQLQNLRRDNGDSSVKSGCCLAWLMHLHNGAS